MAGSFTVCVFVGVPDGDGKTGTWFQETVTVESKSETNARIDARQVCWEKHRDAVFLQVNWINREGG